MTTNSSEIPCSCFTFTEIESKWIEFLRISENKLNEIKRKTFDSRRVFLIFFLQEFRETVFLSFNWLLFCCCENVGVWQILIRKQNDFYPFHLIENVHSTESLNPWQVAQQMFKIFLFSSNVMARLKRLRYIKSLVFRSWSHDCSKWTEKFFWKDFFWQTFLNLFSLREIIRIFIVKTFRHIQSSREKIQVQLCVAMPFERFSRSSSFIKS